MGRRRREGGRETERESEEETFFYNPVEGECLSCMVKLILYREEEEEEEEGRAVADWQ